MKNIIISISVLLLSPPVLSQELIDKKATEETKALYANLLRIQEKGFLFGHHETDAYGIGWKGDANRSDVKDVSGSYPAIHGWDVANRDKGPNNIDGVPYDKMINWMKETYKRGGINTICWHLDNLATGSNSWDKTPAVKEILPGGSKHEYYKERLDMVADYFRQLKVGSTYIPIIWRPYHEHNGDWFWWGKGLCTEEEYIQLWKFTVDYLKDEKDLHHLIYAFSPDRSRMDLDSARQSYLYGYPGDDYVDILGIDNYMDVGVTWNERPPQQQRDEFVRSLSLVSELAAEKKKLAAITETGQEKVTNSKWFTEVILDPVKENNIKFGYIMVWRNDNPNHHYAPHPGHPVVEDFMQFYNDKLTFFESDIQNIYTSDGEIFRR